MKLIIICAAYFVIDLLLSFILCKYSIELLKKKIKLNKILEQQLKKNLTDK